MRVNGARLQELRESRRTSRRQFAEIFGITSGAVFNFETYNRPVKIDRLKRMARFFHVELAELLLEVEPPKNKIRALRKARFMSQEELAFYIGITRQGISAWEVGKAKPDYEALAKFFGVTVEELK